MKHMPVLILCCLAIGVTGAQESAADDGKRPCVAAYEEGQRLKNKGDLVHALGQFAFCDSPRCPAIMQADCQQWLSQVQASLPTVVFRAIAPDGFAIPGALVSVDGGSPRALDGRALAMNPGLHQVVVDYTGYRAVSRTILVSEGEKLKQHDFALVPASDSALPLSASVIGPPLGARDGTSSNGPGTRSRPVLAIALTSAVGVIGGAGFAYFGLSARSGDRQLDSCSPFCDRSSVDGVKRDYLIANISLAVGLVGAATAALLLLIPSNTRRPPDPSAPHSVDNGVQLGASHFSQAF